MSTDQADQFADWFHEELVREYAHECEAWALDRISRVQDRLNATRRGKQPLTCTILWSKSPAAFIQGRYIYIARYLLERLKTDDAVAFVVAHESAHYDLGHLELFSKWTEWLPRNDATALVAAVLRRVKHWSYGPERENEADDYAVRLCARSGLNLDLSVEALQTLENITLDAGDVSGVYGPENLIDPTDPHRDSTMYQMQEWAWTHLRGYQPLRTRLERARKLARAIQDGRDGY